MIEELRAKFLGRFVTTAQGRIQRALEHMSDDNGAGVVCSEFHALAGEASMLGIADLAESARAGEAAAKIWAEQSEASAKVTCARTLRSLTRQVSQLGKPPGLADGTQKLVSTERQKRRVLIVDDSALVAEQLSDALTEDGVTVQTALDVESAIGALNQFRPSLIVADVNIEGSDSDPLCDVIRASPAAERPKLLLFSGLARDELAARAQRVGADGYITKSDGLAGAVKTIKEALDTKPGGAP